MAQAEVLERQAKATAPAVEKKATERLVSLDAYRGLIMLILASSGFGLSVLEKHPGWEWLARQVEHAAWEGCTFWDLIQPAFTFMVGMAMPFAFARREALGDQWGQVFRHVVYRAGMLIVLSNIFSNWGAKPGGLKLQFINVLCQIAFGYVVCALILRLGFWRQVAVATAMVLGYWGLYVLFPGPEGAFSKTGNVGSVLDLKILGYNYSGYYTTLNFVGNAVTILFGCWAGLLVRSERSHGEKLRVLVGAALGCFVLGLGLEPLNPMVKRLWTASFTFFSAGWVVLMLAAFFYVIEMRGWKRWSFPLTVVGMNSLFIYSLGQIGLKGWLDRGLAGFTGKFEGLGDVGVIPHQVLVLAFMWYACYWLYQRKIFFKF